MEPEQEEAVTEGASAASAQQQTSTGDVSPGAGDRPVENLAAEMNRKYAKMQEQLNAIIQALQQPRQAPVAQQPTQPQSATSVAEQLWARAQQGDRQAFEEYQRLIAQQEMEKGQRIQQHAALVNGQLQALMNRYPVLSDPQHALTQEVNRAFVLLQQNGYPKNRMTLLEAMKTAIADHPELIAEMQSAPARTSEQGRRSATQMSQAGQTGTTVRRQGSTPQQAVVPEPVRSLASRMGVKDPVAAMKRFEERQKKGQSAFGAIGLTMPQDGE